MRQRVPFAVLASTRRQGPMDPRRSSVRRSVRGQQGGHQGSVHAPRFLVPAPADESSAAIVRGFHDTAPSGLTVYGSDHAMSFHQRLVRMPHRLSTKRIVPRLPRQIMHAAPPCLHAAQSAWYTTKIWTACMCASRRSQLGGLQFQRAIGKQSKRQVSGSYDQSPRRSDLYMWST